MAFEFQSQYDPDWAGCVQGFYLSLSEKDRRRFVALEAKRLGHGAVRYVADVFDCSERTIERGLAELDALPYDPAGSRVRRPGGGRKKSRLRTQTGSESGFGSGGAHGG